MKKIKMTIWVLVVTILISILTIFLLECEQMQIVCNLVVMSFSCLKGKRALLSNIFLGIFASAFCMLIGEVIALIYLRVELKKEIVDLLDELWVRMNFKDNDTRQGYINNASLYIHYADKIEKINTEFQDKKCVEYKIITSLHKMLVLYKSIYELEYMRGNNNVLFNKYVKTLLKPFDEDIKLFYFMSEYDREIMAKRKGFEDKLDNCEKYNQNISKRIDTYINAIKKSEKALNCYYEEINSGKAL